MKVAKEKKNKNKNKKDEEFFEWQNIQREVPLVIEKDSEDPFYLVLIQYFTC